LSSKYCPMLEAMSASSSTTRIFIIGQANRFNVNRMLTMPCAAVPDAATDV